MGWLEPVLDLLATVLKEYGFSAFLVVLTLALQSAGCVYILRRDERNHNEEIDRLVDERNKLQDYILNGQRRSSSSLPPLPGNGSHSSDETTDDVKQSNQETEYE